MTKVYYEDYPGIDKIKCLTVLHQSQLNPLATSGVNKKKLTLNIRKTDI